MKFTPKSAAQIEQEKKERAESFLLPKGEYDFEVISAEDTVSQKSKAEMIKLKLKVYGNDGSERFVTDYLIGSMEHKLYHFAWGTGLGEVYDAGGIEAEDCEGRAGRVKIKIEKQEGYEPKNAVQDYVVGERKEQPASTTPKGDAADEEESPF